MASCKHLCQNTVNLAKLGRTLKKQLQADPLKASALGIGCVVLLWFWLPLIRKMFPSAPVAASPQHMEMPAPTVTPVATPTKVNRNWQQLAKLRGDDPLTRTSWISTEERDPFLPPWQVKPKVEEVTVNATPEPSKVSESENEAKPEEVEIVPPEVPNLEIQVESILYGKHKRSAIINGKVLREGESLRLAKENESEANSLECIVVSILPNMVIIEYNKHIYEALIQRKGLDATDELQKLSVDALKN